MSAVASVGVAALESAPLDGENVRDLVEGANCGAIIYLRLARWATGQDDLTSRFNPLTLISRDEQGDYEDLEELCAFQ